MNSNITPRELTDFQKYILHRRKAEEMDLLNTLIWRLIRHTDLNITSIRKKLRISSDLFYQYWKGESMIPDGFVEKFKNKFKNELDIALDAENTEKLRWYFDFSALAACKEKSNANTEPAATQRRPNTKKKASPSKSVK